MVVTACVVVVALLSGLLVFVASAVRTLDLDATPELWGHPRLRRFLAERFDRGTRRGFLLTISFAIVIAVAAAIGGVLDMVRTHEGLAEADAGVAKWGSRNATSEAVDALKVL